MKVKSCGEKRQRTEMMHLFPIVPASGRAHQMIPTHAFGQTGDKPPNYKKKNAAPQRLETLSERVIPQWRGSGVASVSLLCLRLIFPSCLSYPTWQSGGGNPQLL